MTFKRKDLLGLADLSREEIQAILQTAASFKEISTRSIKKVPTLRGRTVITLFYEPSTRTRTSFEIAAKRLSADTINLAIAASSAVKGETLIDTAKNLEAMAPDIIIIRHACSGAPHLLAGRLKSCVVNAGDGLHEHPTQALLDMLTVWEAKGRLDGLKVAIIGDIAHSRVARSNIHGFRKMGSEVVVAGPQTMLPPFLEDLGVEVTYSLAEAVGGSGRGNDAAPAAGAAGADVPVDAAGILPVFRAERGASAAGAPGGYGPPPGPIKPGRGDFAGGGRRGAIGDPEPGH